MAAIVTPQPPSGLRFADSFWDGDDRGVEVILDKLRNSKQTCEEIKKLYEIRSQIEEDYGERLLKLSQLIVGQSEEGTLSESLSHIPSALETTARAHLDLAQQLKHHLETPLDGFVKEQRDIRRLHHQQIENARQLKNMHHTNAIKAKEFYTAECTKVAGMEKYLRERGSEMEADEVQQVKEEIEEGKKMVNAAEQEYKRAIEVLGSVTNDWINSWKTTCDTFQGMEEKRIQYVHGSLRSFASMMSSVYLVDDQCCERIRTTLELTDVQSDIQEFIARYGTGREIPGPLQFEPFTSMDIQSGQITPASSVHQDLHSTTATTASAKALPPMPENNANQEPLQCVEQQLQDLNVKRNSLEVSQIKSDDHADHKDIPKDNQQEQEQEQEKQQQQEQPENVDAVVEAIQQVEDMLSIDEKPTGKENQRSIAAPVSVPTIQQDHKSPETTAQQDLSVPEKQPERTLVTPATTINANEAPASVSPDEPPVPTTPPQVDTQTTEPVKDREQEKGSSPPSTAVAPALSASEDQNRAASIASKESDVRFKPMPNPAFKKDDNDDPTIARVDSGSDLNVKDDEQPKDKEFSAAAATAAATAAAAAASGAIAVAATSTTRADNVVSTTEQQQHQQQTTTPPVITTTLTDSTSTKKDDRITTEEDGSEKEYPLPPPKAEKWVISSIRRPQQLPVRAQNARMSMFSSQSPTSAIPAPVDQTTTEQPTTSTASGNKFHRPNAPFKIEIPNKTQQKPTSQPAVQVANNNNNNSYQGTQAAAQQIIAAGRAQAHQASSWQSPINSSPNRRFSSADRYHHSERPIPADPTITANANAVYEDDIGIGRDASAVEHSPAYNNSVGKKSNISSFMKGVLKPANDGNLPNNGSRPSSDKPNHNKAYLQPSVSMSNENKKSKRFSMNVFKKEKKHHKQAEDPIYEDTVTPTVHSSSGGIAAAASASAPILEDPSYGSAPIRPLSTAVTPIAARPSSAIGNNRPMSMAYPPSSQQPQQPELQRGGQGQALDDGTPIIEYVQALWQYDAKVNTEMSFYAGDVFAVIHKQMDNWWVAELMDPRRRQRGLVPGNYMEQVNM